jgi:hypothetical protein
MTVKRVLELQETIKHFRISVPEPVAEGSRTPMPASSLRVDIPNDPFSVHYRPESPASATNYIRGDIGMFFSPGHLHWLSCIRAQPCFCACLFAESNWIFQVKSKYDLTTYRLVLKPKTTFRENTYGDRFFISLSSDECMEYALSPGDEDISIAWNDKHLKLHTACVSVMQFDRCRPKNYTKGKDDNLAIITDPDSQWFGEILVHNRSQNTQTGSFKFLNDAESQSQKINYDQVACVFRPTRSSFTVQELLV